MAIIDASSGRLLSVGSVVAEPLPTGTLAVPLAAPPDLSTEVWEPTSRKFMPRPAVVLVDRLDDLQADAGLAAAGVWSRLTVAQRQALRDRLVTLLGPRRWRRAVEPVDLGD